MPSPRADDQEDWLAHCMAMLPPNARMLVQAGYRDGLLARHYKRIYPATFYQCVEADPALAALAVRDVDTVIQAKLENVGPALFQHLKWADAWLFDGTLEVLAAETVLARIRKVIEADACVVARVANRLHWGHTTDTPALSLQKILDVFQQTGWQVTGGIELLPGAPPSAQAGLQRQADEQGLPLAELMRHALPSHFLIKAVPIR